MRQKRIGRGYYSFIPMFLIILGASLTFGAGLLATVIVLATLAGLMGLRRASLGPIFAASVTLCSGLAVLYMSYFFASGMTRLRLR
jgi:hypothetical protein